MTNTYYNKITEPATARVRVRRRADRARYDRQSVESILDEGFVCHVAFTDGDTPWVIPTAYGRLDDTLYLHGAVGNHVLRALGSGATACVVVTLVDGLVLARSSMHHSMNYRSVVLYGVPRVVTDPEEKRRALDAVVDHIVPGRTAEVRAPNESELRKTTVVALSIDEASAKIRTGGPIDDPDDLADGSWAGVLPLVTSAGPAQADEHTRAPVPVSVIRYRRTG